MLDFLKILIIIFLVIIVGYMIIVDYVIIESYVIIKSYMIIFVVLEINRLVKLLEGDSILKNLNE